MDYLPVYFPRRFSFMLLLLEKKVLIKETDDVTETTSSGSVMSPAVVEVCRWVLSTWASCKAKELIFLFKLVSDCHGPSPYILLNGCQQVKVPLIKDHFNHIQPKFTSVQWVLVLFMLENSYYWKSHILPWKFCVQPWWEHGKQMMAGNVSISIFVGLIIGKLKYLFWIWVKNLPWHKLLWLTF